MKTTCPSCGQNYEIEKENIGFTTMCTGCGKEFVFQGGNESLNNEENQPEKRYSNTTIQPQKGPSISGNPSSHMNTLTCEMCGSSNLVKHDGIFVCQSCGTKYSVEEAKKRMSEGTVSVKETVPLDNSNQIYNLVLQGNCFLEAEEYEQAEKSFSKVLSIESNNIDAQVGKGIASAWLSDLKNPRYSFLNASMNFLLLSELQQNVRIENVKRILDEFAKMVCIRRTEVVEEYSRKRKAYGWDELKNLANNPFSEETSPLEADLKDYSCNLAKFLSSMMKCGDKLLAKTDHEFAMQNYKLQYTNLRRIMTCLYEDVFDENLQKYIPQDVLGVATENKAKNLEILKQLDPNTLDPNTNMSQQNKNSGCAALLGVCFVFIICLCLFCLFS